MWDKLDRLLWSKNYTEKQAIIYGLLTGVVISLIIVCIAILLCFI